MEQLKDSEKSRETLSLEYFSYDLPVELIAQQPLSARDRSRLLVIDRETHHLQHHHFEDIVDLLRTGDVLVVNNTRVIPARVLARRKTGGQIKLLLIRPDSSNPAVWEAMVTPIKRLKPNEILDAETEAGHQIKVVDLFEGPDGFKRLHVDLGTRENVVDLLCQIGQAPLPPYIQRNSGQEREHDLDRYQTVYATTDGAVAAPTAGLHFSQQTIARLQDKGIIVAPLTLHVGPGTFKPIAESLEEHTIEPEVYSIPSSTADAVNAAKSDKRRVISVGTTSMRALESAARDSLPLLTAVENGSTSLFIKPGYKFKLVDGIVTNFHLSRSSLLVLVATFASRDLIMQAYQEAITQRYRFFSYGDAMLIL